jgi:hypothetical protein
MLYALCSLSSLRSDRRVFDGANNRLESSPASPKAAKQSNAQRVLVCGPDLLLLMIGALPSRRTLGHYVT